MYMNLINSLINCLINTLINCLVFIKMDLRSFFRLNQTKPVFNNSNNRIGSNCNNNNRASVSYSDNYRASVSYSDNNRASTSYSNNNRRNSYSNSGGIISDNRNSSGRRNSNSYGSSYGKASKKNSNISVKEFLSKFDFKQKNLKSKKKVISKDKQKRTNTKMYKKFHKSQEEGNKKFFEKFKKDRDELYKGIPMGFYFVGNDEKGQPVYQNKNGRIWIKYHEKKPKNVRFRPYDSKKCYYCNNGVLGCCSCNGVYREFGAEEQERRKQYFRKTDYETPRYEY